MASVLDISAARSRFEQFAQPLLVKFAESRIATGEQVTPPQLVDALRQLFLVLERDVANWDPSLPEDEPERIGDLTIGLLLDLATWADRLGERPAKAAMEIVSVAVAAWLVQNGQPIHTLEPVVNGLAILANAEKDAEPLQSLARLMGAVAEAAATDFAADLESQDPQRPWRILLFNWAITATRAQDPEQMRTAFAALQRYLPADAPLFFQEGRQQVLQGDYTPEVRETMLAAAEAAGHGLH
ncbi:MULTISPECIES: hypothetical protein [Acidithiobacillus]|uniref:Uncharacterized protein n=3 Tax=Acidithiobacillus caldus TaxID=33059 RepID=F9ZPY7_ACICS|nr:MULTISPECIES: hypothetical protein [Acidithiobacillus]AEK58608.1 conserved hypothetical protein [Acidithiobacillus caldus SM-1]AIA55803.1 hypothetical protein Acaty_c1945 [Acidithiobacillus caldus ATCC 51756]AUW33163.1 hypothetical protein A5904_09870 [Acidithiobacillus caldus]MBU2728816.1 hypothetical protein [Acidithiobacillus caldus]MBU2736418.1 hypothetical protein [Acidithiobacillus caldus ATCC 51756]